MRGLITLQTMPSPFRGSLAWKPAASQGEGGCGALWPSEVSCLPGQAAVMQGDGGEAGIDVRDARSRGT